MYPARATFRHSQVAKAAPVFPYFVPSLRLDGRRSGEGGGSCALGRWALLCERGVAWEEKLLQFLGFLRPYSMQHDRPTFCCSRISACFNQSLEQRRRSRPEYRSRETLRIRGTIY